MPPAVLLKFRKQALGTRTLERFGRMLQVTGPERTLVDGFYSPALVVGLAELLECAAGFGVLELNLLTKILKAYRQERLWAATGWFLERHQQRFFVPPEYLLKLERRRPRSPQYLVRTERRSTLVPRWNLVVPETVVRGGEPDEG